MSDSAEEAPAEAAKPKAPKAGTSPIVMALLVLNLGASGFGVFKIMTAQPAAAATMPQHDEKPAKEITGPVIALDPFVVNLDEPGNARYLKMTVQVELVTAHDGEVIEKSKQVIRDEVLSYLSGLHVKDTLGATAKDTIREELMKRMQAVVGEHRVRRMFFQEFMVQ